MAQNTFTMPLERQVEVQRPVIDLVAPSEMPAANLEQTLAVDQVFAEGPGERNSLVDALNIAAVGMLLHDVVKDTLAPPANEEDDDRPKAKPEVPEPEPR